MSDTNENGIPAPEVLEGVPEYAFDWLRDEHALRDEGAFYGLVEGDIKEKENAIRQYFEMFIKSLKKGIELDQSTCNELKLEITGLKDFRTNRQREYQESEVMPNVQPHYFLRHLMGITAYIAMLLFNFWLIYERLSTTTKYPLWVSLGVYLFGILSLVRRAAIVYSDEREVLPDSFSLSNRWKVYAEEYGIPGVSALFVVVQGQTPSVQHGLMIFVLILALFLYAGKGFWQSWLHIQEQYMILKNNRNTKRFRLTRLNALDSEMQKTDIMIEKKLTDIMILNGRIRELNVKLARTEAHMIATISYFKSEFDLARATKRMGIFG